MTIWKECWNSEHTRNVFLYTCYIKLVFQTKLLSWYGSPDIFTVRSNIDLSTHAAQCVDYMDIGHGKLKASNSGEQSYYWVLALGFNHSVSCYGLTLLTLPIWQEISLKPIMREVAYPLPQLSIRLDATKTNEQCWKSRALVLKMTSSESYMIDSRLTRVGNWNWSTLILTHPNVFDLVFLHLLTRQWVEQRHTFCHKISKRTKHHLGLYCYSIGWLNHILPKWHNVAKSDSEMPVFAPYLIPTRRLLISNW